MTKKIKKIDFIPTKDLKDRMIVYYPHRLKISELPLSQIEILKYFEYKVSTKKCHVTCNLEGKEDKYLHEVSTKK